MQPMSDINTEYWRLNSMIPRAEKAHPQDPGGPQIY
jgi:hypothetical protein